MNLDEAINNLMINYGNISGIKRMEFKRLINSGISEGFSVRQCYNGIRLCLGMKYGQQEIFSSAEAGEILKIADSKAFSRMQEIGHKSLQKDRIVFYFPYNVDM